MAVYADGNVLRAAMSFGAPHCLAPRVRAASPGSDLEAAPMIRCPWCSLFQRRVDALIGRLGRLNHYRCRHCGGQFSTEIAA